MLAESGQQMTTDRTAIRRRLSVRRGAHRPPWGGWKSGHRSIVAPLAATIAATVAVGVGVAIARAGRERRPQAPPPRDHDLGVRRGERLADGMRRMALGQADLAIGLLERTGHGAIDERTVHETRKALKRLRALLRLLRGELGEEAFARESAALGDLAARLAGARDAEVRLATLQALVDRYPHRLAHRGGAEKLLGRLAAEHERISRRTLAEPTIRLEVLGGLRAFRARASGWHLPERDGMRLIEPGLERIYRQGRKRYRRAARARRNEVVAMHEWRKRVKDLRYAAEMLQWREAAGEGAKGKGTKKRKARRKRSAEAKALRLLARRADKLGELLGDDHDLAMLAQLLREPSAKRGAGGVRVGRGTRKLLLKLIARRRRELRKDALRSGKRLFARSPGKFVRGVRGAHEGARRQLS
jgi:CHAD domain-containing protein